MNPEGHRERSIKKQEKSVAGEETLLKIKEILEESPEDSKTVNQIRYHVEKYFREKSQIKLVELLPKEAIRLNVECENWEDAIRYSADYLLENGIVEENYVRAMIDNVVKNGPYIVVGKGFALPHEALSTAVKATGLSLIRLQNPVAFGKEERDPVLWVCCLSAIDKNAHLKAMFHIINIFNDPAFRKKADVLEHAEEVHRLIAEYEKEM